MIKLELSLKRVQAFIFDVPRLRAMLGANALVGQTMRHELPKLMNGKGCKLAWPSGLGRDAPNDPLHSGADPDDPAALYEKGILARDGGHFIVVFPGEVQAEGFLRQAETLLAEKLPGVLFEARIEPFGVATTDGKSREKPPREIQLLNLPVLQICQETGREPASNQDAKFGWIAQSVTHRVQWGKEFNQGNTLDIIGLMREKLYPSKMNWEEPNDLDDLTAGDYLALIHADGNGIGKRYSDWKKDAQGDAVTKEAHGEAFFHSMRVAVRRAVVDALGKTFTQGDGKRPYEVLMLGGDDLLLICRADKALDFACNYAKELENYKLADGKRLNVALGVAIARHTYPLHRLHELAEELASSAKRLSRAQARAKDDANASVIDWQVVTQSWFTGVAEARRQSERIAYTVDGKAETLLLTRRPYPVLGDDGLEGLLEAVGKLDGMDDEKAARSPLRALRSACEQGRLAGEMAFANYPVSVKQAFGGSLWQAVNGYHLTRALDIIGIREIPRLGNKTNDDRKVQP
jgi:hypothetical protein